MKNPRNAKLRGFVKSAFGELRRTTGRFEAVLLTLFHTRIAGEETGFFEDRTHLFAVLEQGAGDTMADCTRLTRNTAACNGTDNIKLADCIGEIEGLADDQFQGLETEIIVDVRTVDGNCTGAGIEARAGNRVFSVAGGRGIRL